MDNNFIHSSPFAPSTDGGSSRTSLSSPSLHINNNGLGPLSSSEDTPKPASVNPPTYLCQIPHSTYAISKWHILLTIPLFHIQFCLWDNFSVRIPPWPPSLRGSNDERPISWPPTLFSNLEHAHLQMTQMEFFQQLRSFMESLLQEAPPEKRCILRKTTQCPMTLQEMTVKHKSVMREVSHSLFHLQSIRALIEDRKISLLITKFYKAG